MKNSKMKLSLLALMQSCAISSVAFAQAQDSPPEGFFESNGRSVEERRALYEESRGVFLDKDTGEIVDNSLEAQGFSTEFSTITALQFLTRKMSQDSNHYLIYLDISDQEFEILGSLLTRFTQQIEDATNQEITNSCNQLGVDLRSGTKNSYDVAYAGFEHSQLQAGPEKVRVLESFYDDARGQLGERVVDQIRKYALIFSRSNSFSIDLSPAPGFTSEPNTPENYMNRVCKSFLGAQL